jgi:signal transduction histidine kinase
VARRLAELIGGEIEITSQLGVGTRVLLSIPGESGPKRDDILNHEGKIQHG